MPAGTCVGACRRSYADTCAWLCICTETCTQSQALLTYDFEDDSAWEAFLRPEMRADGMPAGLEWRPPSVTTGRIGTPSFLRTQGVPARPVAQPNAQGPQKVVPCRSS